MISTQTLITIFAIMGIVCLLSSVCSMIILLKIYYSDPGEFRMQKRRGYQTPKPRTWR